MAEEVARQPIPNEHSIVSFLHCQKCFAELRDQKIPLSMKQYAKQEVGFTALGIQIWCVRHDMNIVHIDFEGAKHRASTSARVS